MSKRIASTNELINTFDQIIDNTIDKSDFRTRIEKSIGKSLSDSDLIEYMEKFYDFVFENIEFDLNHLQRFLGFYLKPEKLDEFIDDFVIEIGGFDPAFSLATIAHKIMSNAERTSYIKKEKGKYVVKSKNNPDWSGGSYDTKEEAEKRLRQVEMFKYIMKKK